MNVAGSARAYRAPYTAPWVMALRRAWGGRREQIAGFLVIMGTCWQLLLPDLLPVRWWMFPPFAVLAGVIRWRRVPRAWGAAAPLWTFFLIFLAYWLIAKAVMPTTEYGNTKAIFFFTLAGLAYVACFRMAPLTADFARGLRWGLGITLLLCLATLVKNRDFFLAAETYGMLYLRQNFSLVGLPLVICLSSAALLPRSLLPRWIFAGALGLLVMAAMAVFSRGRFNAMLLCWVAALLVMGPPWRYFPQRVIIAGLLGITALIAYTNILPLFGDSFAYLQWLDVGSLGERAPLYDYAWEGLMAHPLGNGLGTFRNWSPLIADYPHNVILESGFELGLPGFFAMLAIYVAVTWQVMRYWVSPEHRVLAGLVGMLFAQMLKSGDISTFAFQWVYMYILIVMTPLAPSWPLSQRRTA